MDKNDESNSNVKDSSKSKAKTVDKNTSNPTKESSKSKSSKSVRSEKKTSTKTKSDKSPKEIKAPKRETKVEIKTEKEDKEDKGENKVIIVKTEEEYSSLRNIGLVVVDFNTTWCGPCRIFAPIFEELAAKYPGVVFLSVDAENIEHKDCEDIRSVPTFKIFLNGEQRREFTGVDREKLERYIQRYQIQILINGKVQRSFPKELKEKISTYMNMLDNE